MDLYVEAHNMPECTSSECLKKIEAMADSIRSDWSDPRPELRQIKNLCTKLELILGIVK